MITAAFIFEPGNYDEEFHRLDDAIEKYAKSLPGYVKTDRWQSADGKLRNSVYYFETLETVAELARFDLHVTAKKNYAKWYKGYRIEIAELKNAYGDGNL